jgi:hypothetical protein
VEPQNPSAKKRSRLWKLSQTVSKEVNELVIGFPMLTLGLALK